MPGTVQSAEQSVSTNLRSERHVDLRGATSVYSSEDLPGRPARCAHEGPRDRAGARKFADGTDEGDSFGTNAETEERIVIDDDDDDDESLQTGRRETSARQRHG